MLALLSRRQSVRADVSWHPLDSRWYGAIGGSARSDAGIVVVPEKALTIAVIYRAVCVRAHSIASIPLVIYRTLSDEGKEKAKDHPQYGLLHDRPNAWQTSFRWRMLMMVQRILHGNHYSQLMPGPGGVGQLVPLSPVTTRVVDQLADGRLKYITRDVTRSGYGPERFLLQDELLHIRGFSLDGKTGLPLPELARNAMGLALMAEKHGSMFLRKGARFNGVLSTEGKLDPDTRKANEAAWQRAWNGAEGTGGTPIVDGGLKWTGVTANNKDSQWTELRAFQVEEHLRFLGVPGVLCGYADKTATFASAEAFFQSFVNHTVRPEAVDIAEEITQSVVVDPDEYFASFILEGLLKGDIKTRYDAYRIGIAAGFLNRNEVRVKDDMNKGPDALNEYLEPENMRIAGEDEEETDPPPQRGRPAVDEEEEDDDAEDQARRRALIVRRAVRRLVRREIAAIVGTTGKLGAAKRFAGNADGWTAWLQEFYGAHADLVADELALPRADAVAYCTRQRSALEAGVAAVEDGSFELDSEDNLLALVEG